MERADSKSLSGSNAKEPQRAYGCPCGKTYLSYPALFTHVKQKHDGKAPGKLIKPKSGKVRGRPKTRIDPEDEEMNEIITKVEREVSELIEDEFITYEGKFTKSEGHTTCQDISSIFMELFEPTGENGLAIISCFLNELKQTVEEKFGPEHWEKEKPTEIIEVANDLYGNHEEKMEQFPISKEILKELTFNFFEWLFANKYTNHRLLRRGLSETMTTEATNEINNL